MEIEKSVEFYKAVRRNFFDLHKRCNKAQKILDKLGKEISAAFLRGYFMAGFKSTEKIFLNHADGGALVQNSAAFKVQIQSAVVHIRCADGGDAVVGNKIFCMDKAVCVFVNFNSRCDKLAVL